MAGLTVKLTGTEQLQRVLESIRSPRNRRVLAASLTEAAMLTARIAATQKIIRGGRRRSGRGFSDAPADPTRLTSRSGRLRGSLAGRGYRQGIDTTGVPRFIEVGTDVGYGAVHEFGGTVSQTVGRHTRTSAFGRPTKPYQVGPYRRTARYPARPFLAPALTDAAKQFERIFVFHYRRAIEGAR